MSMGEIERLRSKDRKKLLSMARVESFNEVLEERLIESQKDLMLKQGPTVLTSEENTRAAKEVEAVKVKEKHNFVDTDCDNILLF